MGAGRLRETVAENSFYAGAAVFLMAALLVGSATQLAGNTASAGNDRAHKLQYERLSAGAAPAATGGDRASTARKRATSISLEVEVKDVENAQESTREEVERLNGIVNRVSLNREVGTRGSMTVRVPEENVSEFFTSMEDSWRVESRDSDTTDVTDRYTELELELENKRQELRRLEDLMNRTDSVESLVKIQERMGELRSRIQFLEVQLEELDRRVEYTEIRISFEQPQPLETEFELRESVRNAYQGVFQSMKLMIVGTGYLLPFAAVAALAYGVRRFIKQRRQ